MKFLILCLCTLAIAGNIRQPLSYASLPSYAYAPAKNNSITTVLDFINSRDDLSQLAGYINSSAGFSEAFDTPTNWKFTFFAPSNTAFENTGQYFETYYSTLKGKFWFGNLLTHHYIPNSALTISSFNETPTRIQTGSYLYIGTQIVNGNLTLNEVATATDGDHAVTSGVVHIIDRILDPSSMILQADVPNTKQSFIAGSCANTALSYC